MKRLLAVTLSAIPAAHAETTMINIASRCITEDATAKEILPAFNTFYKEMFVKDMDASVSFASSGTLKNPIRSSRPARSQRTGIFPVRFP